MTDSILNYTHLSRTISDQDAHGVLKSNEGFDFGKIGLLQPRLRVTQPTDVYELEADAIADQLMRISDSKDSVLQMMTFH